MTYEIERIANGWMVRSSSYFGVPTIPATYAESLESALDIVTVHQRSIEERAPEKVGA
jgi:hypothetical protein